MNRDEFEHEARKAGLRVTSWVGREPWFGPLHRMGCFLRGSGYVYRPWVGGSFLCESTPDLPKALREIRKSMAGVARGRWHEVPRVVLESPYAGDVELNLRYLRACLADSLGRGEAPFASHGLYTQPGVLDDSEPEERAKGIAAGFVWAESAHVRAVYTDLGVSPGMREAIDHAERIGQTVEYRSVAAWAGAS